jgi:C4-dicarboxylate-specific signal transduction histidine kinase
MKELHKLLLRQLKLNFLGTDQPPVDLNQWQNFLECVHKVYTGSDNDRYLLERSLELSSKEMQERLQALDLEKAKNIQSTKLATLGEMAGSIAHEINNPVGLIHIVVGQLLELIQENALESDFLIDSLKQIEQNALRTAKIIAGLRRFSRDGSNDPLSLTSVKKILDDTSIFCAERFRQHDIKFEVQRVDEALLVACREVEISQVLLNLLNNAFDAIQSAPEKWIRLEVQETDSFISFLVSNSGEKIPDKVQKKLFQPFFTTKEIGKGTGLGLTISRKIAEAHKGSLDLDLSASQTCFHFKILKAS